ncbi:MAG: tetratricopeptide repeat protein [Metallibacterium scheffleri]|nr:hypothetical protein [Alphaproteobacteria bacterium]
MSEDKPICPHCGSARTTWKAKSKIWECSDCEEKFDAPRPADLPDPLAAVEDAFAQKARTLAKPDAWVKDIFNAWPAPIAHTYELLQGLLRNGQIDAAGLVLKDLSELLARFSALVLGSALREWGSDAQKAEVVDELFGKPLSMGDWVRLADGWAAQVLGVEPELPVAPLAKMWRRIPNRKTAFGQWIAETVQWRNKVIGHGVRGADLSQMMEDLERFLENSNGSLHGLLRPYAQLWEGLTLQDATGRPLMGAQVVLDDMHAQGHALDVAQPLHLQGADWTLDLSPFLSARRCQVCGKSEIFLYDSTNARKQVPDSRLLNYERGHAYKISLVRDDTLRACFDAAHPARAVEAVAGFDADALPQDIADMLEEQSVERSYLSPGYLRHPLQAFIESRRESGRGGVYWLRAPSHVGKSTFVRGLDPRHRDIYKNEELDAGLAVAVFYIRREYQFHLAQFAEQLRERLKMAYGLQAQNKPLPSLDLEHPGPQAFAAFLGAFQTLGRRPLLVVIDGLDELAQEDPSIADYLPGPDDLPAEVFVLLTSRPQAELPAWLQPKLAPLQGASGREIGLDDKDYVDLMRTYAKSALTKVLDRLKSEGEVSFPDLMEHLLQASDGRFLYLRFLVDRLADGDLPAEAVQNLPQPEKLIPQYLRAILQRYDNTAQADLMQRTLHVLAITERAFELHQQRLSVLVRQPWRGLPLTLLSLFVEGTPRVTPRLASCLYLLKSLLGTWRREDDVRYRLGIKGLDEVVRSLEPEGYANTVRRLVEQLLEDVSALSRPDDARSAELDWVALHLDGVVDLLDPLAPTDWRDERSVQASFDLINELRDRASNEARDSHHADALGLLTAALGFYGSWLRFSMDPTVDDGVHEKNDTDCDVPSLQKPNISHVICLDKDHLHFLDIWIDMLFETANAEVEVGAHASAAMHYGDALASLWELQLALGEDFTPDMQHKAAKVSSSRGYAQRMQGNDQAALEDYNRAIAIWEHLKKRPDKVFTPDMQDSLAKEYFSRGLTRKSMQGNNQAALEDYDLAIAIWEYLKKPLDKVLAPVMQDYLAKLYLDRGDERSMQGNNQAALEDYDRAIAFLEHLKMRSDEVFTDTLDHLAKAYSARCAARRMQGDHQAAQEDCDQAIAIWKELEDLREMLAKKGAPLERPPH